MFVVIYIEIHVKKSNQKKSKPKVVVINIEIHIKKLNYGYKTAYLNELT